jgi:triosephosphate isomerase
MSLKPLIAANWKMHGDMSWCEKPQEFSDIFPASEREGLDILICPPAVLLFPMMERCGGTDIWLGAQTCHDEEKGAHTGEMSASMLVSAGADFVILGHSERRAMGESSEDVCRRVNRAVEAELQPIICVGETLAQREAGQAQDIVAQQLDASIPEGLEDYVIAYEPVWAIGTGKTATPDDVEDMHRFIRGKVGGNVRILYGGSVKPANAQALLAIDDVNGALIGGAGLEMESLAAIARLA